jgi:uncharacterized membrane protein
MANLIVISFKDEAQAFKASHKLAELESFGDISMYEKVIVRKDFNGKVTELQNDTSDGLRVAGGFAVGTMVGALAGPVGMLVGMLSGSLIGTIAELDYDDFSDEFISKVNDRILPGTVAIMAEVGEDNPDFVDNAVSPLGATIFRADVDDVYDYYDDEEVDAFDEEIAKERSNIKAAAASDKAAIQKRIADLKEKRKQRVAELNKKHDENKKSRLEKRINKQQEKIAGLQQQLKNVDK